MSSIAITPQADTSTLAEQLDVLADRLVVSSRRAQVRDVDSVLRSVDRLLAAVVTALMATTQSGVVVDEGMTTASWLRAVAGRSGADAGMLLAAAERLADMPAVVAWFTDGTLSWSAVRGIVAATRNLTADQRRWVDATLATEPARIARLDADQIIAAVARLVDEVRPDLHREQAARSFDRQFLALQPAFDGSGQMYAEMDSETTAIALQALRDITGDSDLDDGGGGGQSPRSAAGQGRSSLEAFKALCHLRLNRNPNLRASSGDYDADGNHDTHDRDAGGSHDAQNSGAADGPDGAVVRAAPSTARPSMLVITDLALLTGTPDGVGSATAQLLWRTDRNPIELTAEAAQRLACDATLRHVLVDGAQVLGVGATHPKVSAKLRAALEVRDGGCRFTACRRPTAVCENHHVIPKAQGGPTELTNLALLCTAHHHAVHEGRWQATLHADATMTFTRRGTTLTSLARGDQQFQSTRPPPRGRPKRQAPIEDPDRPQDPAVPPVNLPF